MSNKEKKKNANKSLEALKRKQYARGGRTGRRNPRDKAKEEGIDLMTLPKPKPQPIKKATKVTAAPQPIKAIPKQQISDPAPTQLKNVVDPKSLFSDPNLGSGVKNTTQPVNYTKKLKADMGDGGASLAKNVMQPLGNQQGGSLENVQASNEQARLGQDVLKSNQQFNDNVMNSTEYQEALSALQSSGGKDEEAKATLNKMQGQMQVQSQNMQEQSQQAQSQNVTQQSMMGNGFTGLTPAQIAQLAEDYGNQGGQVGNGQETTADTDPSGGPENKATLIGLDGREYSSNAALEAANARYLAAQAAENATTKVTTQGITKEAPTGIAQDAPVADLRQMEAESILKPVPEANQWADKLVDQYPDLTDSQREELRAWGVKNKQGSEAPFPAFFSGMDFLKGLEAANNMKYDTTARAPEGTVTSDEDIQKLEDATDATSGEVGIPKGYSTNPKVDIGYPAVMPADGKIFVYDNETGARREIDDPRALTADQGNAIEGTLTGEGQQAERYDATTTEGKMDKTVAAQFEGDLTKVEAGEVDVTAQAPETQRDAAAEEAALGTAADRPEYKDYATAAQSDKRYEVLQATDPVVADRIAQTMSEREQKDLLDIVSKEGVNLEDLPEYAVIERTTAVGKAKSRKASEIGDVPPVDMQERQGITGEVSKGNASQIGGIPTAQAATMDAVTGPARMVAAADMLAVVANVPKEVTAALVEDPATVMAQIDSGADPKTIAAVAALPVEALVSTQMEGLLAGMEDGETPAWARPAVAALEAKMAQRGLSTSTVGRDALFNAIIQSALPIAQSNAQALQQRAQQNLSNEQQANMSTAQNTMQVRMQNLANSQTSASQTASMANEIKKQKNSFEQQAVMTTAQQKQETDLTNAQMAQQRAQQESAQKQQAAISTLGAGVQADLANLQAMNAARSQDMTADQQSKLATYNAQVSRIMRQADLDQDMEKANISNELQLEMKNLTEQNATDRASMSAVNQGRLADLNVLVDFKKTNANLAQQMDLANLNNDQQMELANLSEEAATNSANMTEASKVQLQKLTIYTNMMAKNEDLRQNAEMAQLSASEKVQLANLTFENQADSESMNAENTAQLQIYEKKMQAGQVNAQLAQQMGLANLSNEQSAAMFNAQMNANFDMSKMSNEQQMEMANSKFMQTMTATKFSADQQTALSNASLLAQTDLANADARTRASVENAKNFLTKDMANLSNSQQAIVMDQQMAQQALLSDQSAQNAAKQFGATSQNQIDQFMISQSNNMMQFNTSAQNAMESFNVTETNRTAAIEAGNTLQADSLTAQLEADISKFNASIDNQRDTWNAANAQAVEQSNVSWRRQANTADTAAANAANQQNVQNAYNISALDQTQLWQQLRDEAAYVRQSYENNEQREAQLIATAIGNESAAGEDAGTTTRSLINMISNAGFGSGVDSVNYNSGGGSGNTGSGSGQNNNQQK